MPTSYEKLSALLKELFQLDHGGQGMFGQGGQGGNGTCDGTCQLAPTPTVEGTDG